MVRLKHRYIIAQILPAVSVKYSAIHKFHPITARDIQASLRSAMQELYGDIGYGEFGLSTYIRFLDGKHSNIFVVKTTRDAQVRVHFALSCMRAIGTTTGPLSISDSEIPIVRSISVHSCPRTCLAKLREVFHAYFEALDGTTTRLLQPDLDRDSALELIYSSLDTLEL